MIARQDDDAEQLAAMLELLADLEIVGEHLQKQLTALRQGVLELTLKLESTAAEADSL